MEQIIGNCIFSQSMAILREKESEVTQKCAITTAAIRENRKIPRSPRIRRAATSRRRIRKTAATRITRRFLNGTDRRKPAVASAAAGWSLVVCPFLCGWEQNREQFVEPVIRALQIQPAEQRFYSCRKSIFCNRGRFWCAFRLGIASVTKYLLFVLGQHRQNRLCTGCLCAGTNQMNGFAMQIFVGDKTGVNEVSAGHQFIDTVAHMSKCQRAALLECLFTHQRVEKICHNSKNLSIFDKNGV